MKQHESERIAAECKGKHRMTGSEAATAAKNYKRRKNGEVNVYKCGVCGGWHIGGIKSARIDRIYRREKFHENLVMDDE